MSKIIVALTLILSCFSAQAGPYGHRHHHHGHGSWIAPLIIGGLAGAVIVNQTRPPAPPVVYQQLPPPPYGYQYSTVYDYNCYCYKYILIPNY
jgi:hypothetical protein